MKNNIKAEIVAHSKRANTGEEIITYKLTFPRIILSEVNTYKMLEKNTSSCLSGDTLILVYDGENFKEVEIKDLFNNHKNLEIASFNEDYSFILQKIGKVFHSGVKPVYRIRFHSGFYLDCTEDHRLLVASDYNNEFVTLRDFSIKQENGKVLIDSILMSIYFIGIDSVERLQYKYENLQVDVSEKIYIATNSSSYSSIKYREYETYEPMRITNIEYLGEMDTYDIEVNGKYHNFVANGIVVHNSRAIPFEKMVEVVEKEPFVPIAWQLSHKGMQGNEYLTDERFIEHKNNVWLEARDWSIESAKTLVSNISYPEYDEVVFNEVGQAEILNTSLSKNYGNRLLEPFMWVTQLCTGTRESFEHLFKQRCPIYNVEGLKFTSKKEAIELYPHLKDMTNLEWLQCNSGQAEIHFMDLAEKMYDVLNESKPDILKGGEWHIPFSEDIWSFGDTDMLTFQNFIRISVCLTAKISYTKIGDENTITLEKAREMYERLKNSGHWSCFGHIAKCMTDKEYENWVKGYTYEDSYSFNRVIPQETQGYNKNLRGFISLRQYVEDGVEITN